MEPNITTQWLLALGLLILNAIAVVILRWLFSKVRKQLSEQELMQLQDWVSRTVAAVEQLYNSGQIQQDERFKFALNFVKQKYPSVNYEIIKVLIEECVFAMKQIPEIAAGAFDEEQ